MVDSVGDGGCCFWDLLAHVYEVGVAVFFGAFLLCVFWLVLSVGPILARREHALPE